MGLPAHDETSRIDVARRRLATALNRLEGVLAKQPVAPVAEPSPGDAGETEDAGALGALRDEVAALKLENASLEGANSVAITKIEDTITRLKSVLGT